MARPDDPPAAPVAVPAPASIPDRRRRVGLVAGIAITVLAIAVAVAFGLSRDDDSGRVTIAAVAAQDGEIAEPAPPDAATGAGFATIATAGGWAPIGARADTLDGDRVTTVFWGRGGRRVAHTALPNAVPPPDGARRTGRRGVLLHSFDVGPRTAVTWTEDGRTSVISSIGATRAELYDLAGGPPRRP